MTGPPLLHVDVDAFFASVEQRDAPSLAEVPMAVGDVVVACANYPARRIGVHAGSSAAVVRREFPQLVLVAPRYDVYERASAELFGVLEEVARTVEPGSMEEGFLDVAGLGWDQAPGFAQALQSRIRSELGLPVSIGVGRTKLMAKLASRAAKPGGVRVIDPEQEVALRPGLALEDLWGVGPRTRTRLAAEGVATVADLAGYDLAALCALAGTGMGRRLHSIALGTDDAIVRPRGAKGPKRSISAQRTLSSSVTADLEAAARRLADTVAGRLEDAGLAGRRLTLTDLGDVGSSVVLSRGVHSAADLLPPVVGLLGGLPATPAGVRLVVDRLEPADAGGQLELPGMP